ncbi:MAG: DUF6012 family protein [Haliea sp.]
MLIHLTPKLFINPRHIDPQHDISCELLDIQCPELGLCLHGGEDVVACRPYPNKGYHVARRKVGRKAVNGLLVQTNEFLSAFTLTTRWNVCGDPDQGNRAQVLTHRVHYTVLDDEHEAVSDCMLLWYGRDWGDRHWPSRWPADMKGPPVRWEPRMDLVPGCRRQIPHRDFMDKRRLGPLVGFIREREETFAVPTLEPERLFEAPPFPGPPRQHAFGASIAGSQPAS